MHQGSHCVSTVCLSLMLWHMPGDHKTLQHMFGLKSLSQGDGSYDWRNSPLAIGSAKVDLKYWGVSRILSQHHVIIS